MAEPQRVATAYRWLYPELEFFDSPEEQLREMAAARGWIRWWIGVIVGVLAGAGLRGTMRRLLGSWTGLTGFYLEITQAFIVLLVVCVCLSGWVYWRTQRVRRKLRLRLVEKGVPICVECGYDLSAQREPRCPECGCAFDPALLREE